MNKTVKINLILAAVICAVGVFAAPPKERKHNHRHDKDNHGVRLATDIVRLVGASLDIFAPRKTVVVTPPAPVVVNQPAVVATTPAPVVVNQPAVVATTPAPVVVSQPAVVVTTPPPIMIAPAPRRYYRLPPPPPRHHRHHGPHHGGRR